MNKSAKRSHSRETADPGRTGLSTGPSGAGGVCVNQSMQESNSPMNNNSQDLPQSSKGLTLSDAENFISKSMRIFHSLSELSDLKSLYELGKQLSRLYFDCAEFRQQISVKLIRCEFPEYVVRIMKKLNNLGIFKHDDIWFSSFYFYNICWNYSECSFEFATSLATAGLPSLLIMNILHKPYLENLSSRNIYFLIKASLSIMHNLCRYPGNRYLFKSDKVKETLIDFTGREEELIRVISILCLAFLLEDEEAALLTKQSNNFVYNFIDIITKAKLHDRGRFMGFATWELLQALSVFTSNDSVKRDIVDCRGVSMIFDILSKASNYEEVKECLAVLWNLSFDAEVRNVLLKQYNCLQVIDCYVNHEEEDIRNAAAGIKWLLEDYMKNNNRLISELMQPQPLTLQTSSTIGFHLFICFAEDNREIVYRIADKLKRANLSIVIPKNSNLEPALKNQENRFRGIVQSSLFIFVLSEASKSSQQCRAEAQYAAFLKKPIIPVIVQSKFKAAGWMEKFTDKVFFDFGGKRDFDANMEILKSTLLSECFSNNNNININNINNNNNNNNDEVKSVHSVKSSSSRPDVSSSNRLNLGHSADSSNLRSSQHHLHHLHHQQHHNIHQSHPQFNHSTSLDSTTCHQDNVLPITNNNLSTEAANFLPELVNNIQAATSAAAAAAAASATSSTSPFINNIESVKKWTKEDVAEWLVNSDLSHLRLKLAQFNGVMLASLLEIKREAPEYFYKCLEDKIQLHFMDTLAFIDALHKLMSG